MKQAVQDLLSISRGGLPMLAKFIWVILGLIGIWAALQWLIQAKWEIPVWLLIFSIIIALSIGLLLYFGQKDITQDCVKHNEYLENYLSSERTRDDRLEQENTNLKNELKKIKDG